MKGRKIYIMALWVMTPEGRVLTGGSERWTWDLARLLNKKGYTVEVYQRAEKPFFFQINEQLSVTGVECSLKFSGYFTFCKWLNGNLDLEVPAIFVSQEQGITHKFKKAVSINHGIWWDGDMGKIRLALLKRYHAHLLRKFRKTICVDTNYINWCHTELSRRTLWQDTLVYIHNYASLEDFPFLPVDENEKKGNFTILYPRRLMGSELEGNPRGIGFFLKVVEQLEKEGCTPFYKFVGRGELHLKVEERLAAIGVPASRYEIKEATFDSMKDEYRESDVVVIPTIAHEGTSLSAIEAIVSGKPTVVTHIGGLGNIVLDGFNGYISDLNVQMFADSIKKAYAERKQLNRNSELIRDRFSKANWEEKVTEVLKSCNILEA